MGSKRRHAKQIIPIILADRRPGQAYVEPFVGGANLIEGVTGARIGADINPHLICLLSAVADGWEPPGFVSNEMYNHAKENREITPEVGFIGFLCSFGGRWFEGFARNSRGTNFAADGRRALLRQAPLLKGISFSCGSYETLIYPEGSIIYCDPPYFGAKGYGTTKFDHVRFWAWVRSMTAAGHAVFVSEHSAPEDFRCVWSKEVSVNIAAKHNNSGKRTERLFVFEGRKES